MSDQNHECGESCEKHQHADTIRELFLNQVPDGVMSEIFKNHCRTVWSEENAALMEVNALLDEVLSMVDELGDRLACMGKALEEAECAGAAKNKTNRSNHG